MELVPQVRIPKEDLPAVRAIMDLPADSFDSLVAALKDTAPTFTPQQLSKILLPKLKGFTESDLFEILNTACALYFIRTTRRLTTESLAQAVSQSLPDPLPENPIPKEKRQQLKDRLAILLSLEGSLAVTAKAVDVRTEQERVFCNTRIISDIRAVFTSSETSAPAAMIIHNLQIGYHHSAEGNKHQEFYVSMDMEDLVKLKKEIERAEKKTETLKAILKASNVTYLEV
jgi:hypothetical protein